MAKQHLSQKELLEKATLNYAGSIHLAHDYLEKRGITPQIARQVRLGVVEHPEVGHEMFAGRLAIPYITKTGVVDLRFRALDPNVEPKYLGMDGVKTKLYNVKNVEKAENWIGVCEGELDTITLSYCVGIPCVGVPGANSWKPHYSRLLQDFERVYVFADGDQAGTEFGRSLARELPVTVVQLPAGSDVNSAYCEFGKDYLIEKAGLNDE